MQVEKTSNLSEDKQLTLTVIGSGDAFGSGGKLQTCFHINADIIQFLIDCGATTVSGLKRNNIAPDDIEVILITHFHGDHYGGLPYFLLECAVYGRSKPLTIVSPPNCEEKIETLLDLLYPSSTVLKKLNIKFIEYHSGSPITIGPLTAVPIPVIHTEAAVPHGLRITVQNKTISYSGDTEWTNNLIDLVKDADLFICECNFYKTKVKGHLNYETLLSKLPLLLYKKILLTHMDKEMLENLDKVTLPYATDNQKVII